MKYVVDLTGKQMTVSLEPVEKKDENGKQKTERNTGRPMWSTQVFVLDQDGGEVIAVTTAGEKPNVKVGALVSPVQLEIIPWAQVRNGNLRSGVAFRATELLVPQAGKSAA